MENAIKKALKRKKFVVTDLLIKLASANNLSLNEFLVLMYLDNSYSDNFDLELMSSTLGLPSNIVMNSFNSLMVKKLVTLETSKDLDGRRIETVNLNGLYESIEENTQKEIIEEEKENIFQIFEREFGKTISSYQVEIINGWLMAGFSEEIVIAALKEAVLSGAANIRYIDAILREWQKNNIKTKEDVEHHLKERRSRKASNTELFDCNWLDEDE